MKYSCVSEQSDVCIHKGFPSPSVRIFTLFSRIHRKSRRNLLPRRWKFTHPLPLVYLRRSVRGSRRLAERNFPSFENLGGLPEVHLKLASENNSGRDSDVKCRGSAELRHKLFPLIPAIFGITSDWIRLYFHLHSWPRWSSVYAGFPSFAGYRRHFKLVQVLRK